MLLKINISYTKYHNYNTDHSDHLLLEVRFSVKNVCIANTKFSLVIVIVIFRYSVTNCAVIHVQSGPKK